MKPSNAFSKTLLICLLTLSIGAFGNTAHADELNIERLTWAGIKLTTENTTVLIDAVGTDLWDGNAPEGLVAVTADTRRRYALITHTHNDHFDLETLKQVLGDRGYVICHESIAAHIASRGLRVIPAKMWQPVIRGGFVFTAVPADDGLGAEQVSWVVSSQGKRIFHGGDTLWHGKLEDIGLQFGPFDAAFLPINGARISRDPMPETPAVLTPTQALDAALLLQAKVIVPIHFGLNDPPHYIEVDQPLDTLITQAAKRNQKVQHIKPGKSLIWPD
jgi:L-ascorbate metabolism protein UlaG (beta-lactamase superfamily)